LKKIISLVSLLSLFNLQANEEDLKLAKESQNPIGNLISVPFEFNATPDNGPEGGDIYSLNVKPVYPVTLDEDLTLINRFTIPFAYQESLFPGQGSDQGLGNITYQGFFAPKNDSGLLWGVGPAFYFPTYSNDRFGDDAWAAGLAAVVLAKPGNWLVGGLVQHLQDYAGDDTFSQSLFQYFINYNFDDFYLTSTPTMVYDWNADSDNDLTLPVGGGIGKLFRFGKMPVDIKFQTFWNVERPEDTGEFTAQLLVKFLFPK
jgi:hypothetical protein